MRKSVVPRDPWAVKIGERIQAARKAKKWRLEDLEAHALLGLSRLGNYEAGLRMPRPAELLKIAAALGGSPAYLMALTDDEKPQEVRDSAEGALLELFRTVDPPDRKSALDWLGAKALLKKTPIPDEKLEHLSAKHKIRADKKARARQRAKGTI